MAQKSLLSRSIAEQNKHWKRQRAIAALRAKMHAKGWRYSVWYGCWVPAKKKRKK